MEGPAAFCIGGPFSDHERAFDSSSRDLQRLTSSANASDLAVDLGVFLIEALLRYGRRCRNIGCTRLAVAYRR